MSFSTRLKTIRKSKKISLKELANGINVHVTQITRWEDESKNSSPSVEKAFAIANYLGVTVDELVFDIPSIESKANSELRECFTKILTMPETNKQSVLALIKVIVEQNT